MPKGQLVVSTKSNIETYNQTFVTKAQPLSLDVPLVILINQKSASASEIVAGALQDLDRAVIVGKRSFGKGLVQKPTKLPYGSQLKVTISRYYTPSGRCIQALNYRDRKEDGSAIRYKINEYTAFKTKNGRTVYDGGGISPDIVIGNDASNKFIESLLNSSVVFDFANLYYHNNTLKTFEYFRLSTKDYDQFKELSLQEKYNAGDIIQKEINHLRRQIHKEGFLETDASFEALKIAIDESKLKLINTFKSDIISVLEGEIIKRYFYREGMYDYFINKNEAVFEAQKLINNHNKYLSILK